MKSRHIILTMTSVVLMGFQTELKSQDTCATTLPPGVTMQMLSPYGSPNNLVLYRRSQTTTPSIRLAVHIVKYSNGTGGLSQQSLDSAISILNSRFSQAMMSFYIYRQDVILSDTYAALEMPEVDALRSLNVVPNCINVYFVPVFAEGGIASFTFHEVQGIIIVNGQAASSTFPHEVGHYFDLFHTHGTSGTDEENIGRLGEPCFNADTAGDLLTDTNADRGLYRHDHYDVNENCGFQAYENWPADDCGRTDWAPPTTNIMSYSRDHCRTHFTQQQRDKMNYTLTQMRTDLLISGDVTLTNLIGSTNAGGTLFVGGTQVASGGVTFVQEQTTHLVGTNNERFTNFQGSGTSYKHNRWNDAAADRLLKRNVLITQGSNQRAQFEDLQSATITSSLIGGGGTAMIEFRDPWHLHSNGTQPDSFFTYNSPFSPTGAYNQSSGGVFLNQNPNFLPNLPIYSVRAPLVTTINGSTAFFSGWSYDPNKIALGQPEPNPAGYDQKAVVFKQAGAVLTAQYSHSTVAFNTTLPAGTYPIAGTLTVPSGVTLTIGLGATLQLPTGAALTIVRSETDRFPKSSRPTTGWLRGLLLSDRNP